MTRLPRRHKLSLAREILCTYFHVRWVMRGNELPRIVAVLRRPAVRPGDRRDRLPLPDGARDGLRLGAAVVRTLSLLPSDPRCLIRSLVLLRLLARRRTDGKLIIAVLPSDPDGLRAHAWIELGGKALLTPATEDYGRLVSL